MKTIIKVEQPIDLTIGEYYENIEHIKYANNAKVNWKIEDIKVNNDIYDIKVARIYEAEDGLEIYNDEGEYVGNIGLRSIHVCMLHIEKKYILEAYKTRNAVKYTIENSELLDEYIDEILFNPNNISRKDINSCILCGDNFDGETIELVTTILV